MIFKRHLDLKKLIQAKSYFLLGPRSTGKTYLIRHQLSRSIPVIDLLESDRYSQLLRRPQILRETLPTSTKYCVIDEVQKLPHLLDEVHWLIENRGIQFLLTGSSARKLKRGGANMLGGRARQTHIFPLTSSEIENFDLVQYLNRGGLPSIYNSKNVNADLKAYADLYLKEEVLEEGLARKIDHFARFIDLMGFQSGKELNYEEIGSDSGVAPRTVESYLNVVEETFFGFTLPAFTKTKKRKAIRRSKFYLFDVGVARYLSQVGEVRPKSESFGNLLEHFVINEVRAYLGYFLPHKNLSYWRSTSQFEVDLIVDRDLAIEVKSTDLVTERHLRGLNALREDGLIKKYLVVSLDRDERTVNGIRILPLRKFLHLLWNHKLLI